MRILFLGDVFGKPGRSAVKNWLPEFRRAEQPDFVIANAENAAGGKGTTAATANDLFSAGVDALTGGNHSFQHREIERLLASDPRFLRPANMPPGTPGQGLGIFDLPDTRRIAVLNLQGRALMKPIDCPFRAADDAAAEALRETPILIVDFHAETTSEKMAMAHYLDGRATAVIGTHTHVPTADARVTARGTAAITDVGMCGPYDSVIGVETRIVLDQLIVGLPVRHEVAKGDARVSGLLIDLDADTGRALACRPVLHPDWPRGKA
jgi:metallophosphoesterase (TIGR00282 family)